MKKIFLLFLVLTLVGGMLFAKGKSETEDKVWPKTHPVVTVGFGAGGGTDTAVRPVIAKMEEYLGETINVTNMEGATSAVAAQHVLNRPRDGYSMYATGSGAFAGFKLRGTSTTDWTDWISWHPFVGPAAIVVRADSDMEDFDDVLAYLKSDKKVNFAIGSFGNGPHVMLEAILDIAGISPPNYVTLGSCRSAAVSVVAGDNEVSIGTFSSTIDFVKAGELRAIAITMAEPYKVGDIVIPPITELLEGSDDIPLLAETWPIMIPRDVPANIVDKVTEAFLWAIEQPEITEYAANQALQIAGYYGEKADKFLSFTESGYAWVQWNGGLVENDPAKLGIPTLAEWNWETEKKKITK